MPNPNTGAVNPALEPEAINNSEPLKGPSGSEPGDKYGNRDNKDHDGGRENNEQTRKAHSSKNNDVGDDTTAKA